MLKIGQNWGKTANYPPNAQHKLAPLVPASGGCGFGGSFQRSEILQRGIEIKTACKNMIKLVA